MRASTSSCRSRRSSTSPRRSLSRRDPARAAARRLRHPVLPQQDRIRDRRGHVNEFHVKRALSRRARRARRRRAFPHALVRPAAELLLGRVARARRGRGRDLRSRRKLPPTRRRPATRGRCTSSSSRAARRERLAGIAPRLSVLADRDEWVLPRLREGHARLNRGPRTPSPTSIASSTRRELRRDASRGRTRTRVRQRDRAIADRLRNRSDRQHEEIARRASFSLVARAAAAPRVAARSRASRPGASASRREPTPLSSSVRMTGW